MVLGMCHRMHSMCPPLDPTQQPPAAPQSRLRLNAARLASRLHTLGYGPVDVVATTGSTNTDLREMQPPPGNLHVRIAEQQTAGRGRRGRTWQAPASSGIIASLAWHATGIPSERLGLVPLLVGTAIAEATGGMLKWPNDVLVRTATGERKLAGILVEVANASAMHETPVLIIGFGVNYDLQDEELHSLNGNGEQHDQRAAARALNPIAYTEIDRDERQAVLSREDLTIRIFAALQTALERFQSLGGDPVTVLPRYRQLCATLGITADIHLPTGTTRRVHVVDIDSTGGLLVRDVPPSDHVPSEPATAVSPGAIAEALAEASARASAASTMYNITAADVEHLRPTTTPGSTT